MKSKRFEPIREVVARSADELQRAMVDSQRRVAELEQQHEQLKLYREEYIRKATQSAGAMDAVRLQNYRAFLDRLTDVIRQHVQKLGVARADYESRRTLWSAKRIEAETLGRAVERFRRDETQAADRREQREGDETAMRLALAANEGGYR
jgi:flagellar export protein FliJ